MLTFNSKSRHLQRWIGVALLGTLGGFASQGDAATLAQNTSTSGNGWRFGGASGPIYAQSVSLSQDATVRSFSLYQTVDNSASGSSDVRYKVWSFSDTSTPPDSGTELSASLPFTLESPAGNQWLEQDVSPVFLTAGQYWFGAEMSSGTTKAFNDRPACRP